MKVLTLILTTLLLTACGKSLNHNSNVQSSCPKNDRVTLASMSSQEHYESMIQCHIYGNHSQVTTQYSLAGVKTWLNAHNHSDEQSKQQHHEFLQQTLSKITQAERNLLWTRLQSDLSDPVIKRSVCNEVEQIGKTRAVNDQIAFWDWENAMAGYLHCSGTITL